MRVSRSATIPFSPRLFHLRPRQGYDLALQPVPTQELITSPAPAAAALRQENMDLENSKLMTL
jgi:hypothetical protein